jgi:hypothetical protein
MIELMKILNTKVRLAAYAFVKFMKSRGISLNETIEMVETVWGDDG